MKRTYYIHPENESGKRRVSVKIVRKKGRSLKVRATSRAIPKSDYDDYGVDEDTVKFFVVEFCDTEDDFWATNCVCSILTLNSKGQIGSADVPYDFDYEGTSADFTIAFAEKINAIVAAKQR